MSHPRLFCLFVLLQLLPPMASSFGSLVRNLPGFPGDLPFRLETGYIGVGQAEEVQIFYLFVESQRNPSQDPVLFWQLGGPGCSALSSFFFENVEDPNVHFGVLEATPKLFMQTPNASLGSSTVKPNTKCAFWSPRSNSKIVYADPKWPLIFEPGYYGSSPKLELNPYSWTQVLNVILTDMPVGTGFSYSETQEGYYASDTKWIDEGYEFLQKWFIEHPNFTRNPFYIGGGSYSGIPIPPLVQKVYEGNNASSSPLMNIKGYVLGSPFSRYPGDKNFQIEYAYRMALLSEELYQSLKVTCNGNYININPNNTKCVSDYQTFSDLIRYLKIEQILEPVCLTIPNEKRRIITEDSETTLQSMRDPYTFWCRDYNNKLLDNWANDEKVREALHVQKGTKGEFQICNGSLAYTKNIPDVVEFHRNLSYTNLQSLIYCADLDMGVPHFATENWIRSLNLTIAYPWRAWFVEGQVAGYTEIRTREDNYYMTYATVKGAGHVAEIYKPKEVFNLIERWFSFSVI